MADSLNSLWFENFITLFTYSSLISDSTLLAFFVLDIYDVTSFAGNARAVSVAFPFKNVLLQISDLITFFLILEYVIICLIVLWLTH